MMTMTTPRAGSLRRSPLRGYRTWRAYENGANTYYTNDAAGQLLALAHVKTNGGSVLVQVDYGYNAVGNRTNRVESFTGFSSATDAYSYDATDQLTGVSYSGGARTANYAYDKMGNLTNRLDTGSGTNTFTANNLNQLTAISGSAIGYDLKGNLTNRPGWLYTWNAKNQLTIAEPSSPTNGAVKITFAYDGLYRCVRRQSWTWDGSTYSLSASAYLLYSGWNLIEERDAGTNVVSYVHGPSMDEMVAKFTSTNTVFYHGDAQHSTLALTDASANVLERYRYEAFGLPTIFDSAFNVQLSSAYGNRMLFQGRQWLADAKLSDHRRRYYSPEIARWLARDPIKERGGINLYMFLRNSPQKFSDAFGLASPETQWWADLSVNGSWWQRPAACVLGAVSGILPDSIGSTVTGTVGAGYVQQVGENAQYFIGDDGTYYDPGLYSISGDGFGNPQLGGDLTGNAAWYYGGASGTPGSWSGDFTTISVGVGSYSGNVSWGGRWLSIGLGFGAGLSFPAGCTCSVTTTTYTQH